ncbi:hypothetical protein NSX27_20020, partial [Salmonella enterica]
NTKRPMMFIRRFTDKKLSTYIRTSQYAVRRKRYSTENWKTFRIFCCVLHLSGKKPGIRAV